MSGVFRFALKGFWCSNGDLMRKDAGLSGAAPKLRARKGTRKKSTVKHSVLIPVTALPVILNLCGTGVSLRISPEVLLCGKGCIVKERFLKESINATMTSAWIPPAWGIIVTGTTWLICLLWICTWMPGWSRNWIKQVWIKRAYCCISWVLVQLLSAPEVCALRVGFHLSIALQSRPLNYLKGELL